MFISLRGLSESSKACYFSQVLTLLLVNNDFHAAIFIADKKLVVSVGRNLGQIWQNFETKI